MAIRPAVPGLLKHQLHLTSYTPRDIVYTFWTWKAVTPIPAARVTYEQGAIIAWLSSHWRQVTGDGVRAELVATRDQSTNPSSPLPSAVVFPNVSGLLGDGGFRRTINAVIALRTQAVGSATRNRNNGRLFHTGLTSVQMDVGLALQAVAATNLIACYTNLLTRLDPAANPDSGDWSIASFYSGGAIRAVPLITPINHVLARSHAGIILKRQTRFGPYPRGA